MPTPPSDAGHDTSTALADQPHAPVTLALTSADDARQFIEKLAANRLRAFKAAIDPATGEYLDDPYAQNKSLSEHIAADYHGRCLSWMIDLAQTHGLRPNLWCPVSCTLKLIFRLYQS